ncbi:MAG TPA: hypothetical protein VNE67_08960 [Acetobacteraceae bacterium]|nr:hypothetical protein [Acetobacteraceae bacterium]
MARQFRLWENGQVVSLLAPAADAGGRTSAYVSVKNAHKAFVVCLVNQGSATTVVLSPLQATDNAGTNSKAITSAPIVADVNTGSSDALVAQVAAASFTTDAGTNNKLVIFEIDPVESMDLNNTAVGPFQHIAIQTGASNAANITAAVLVSLPLRYAQQVPPSVNV